MAFCRQDNHIPEIQTAILNHPLRNLTDSSRTKETIIVRLLVKGETGRISPSQRSGHPFLEQST